MRPLLLLCLLALPAFALGPFEKNHPLVAEGLAAYEKGEFEQALQKFDEAKKELPRSAALEFNRGNALFKLGRFDEARDAYQHVFDLDKSDLTQRDYYNLGNAFAAGDKQKEAIAAYRKALTLDPRDQLARHNLEVVLRKLPPPKKDDTPDAGTPDSGTPDAGARDAGRPDAGQDAGRPDAGQDAGSDGGQPDGGADGGQDGGADGGPSDAGQDGGTPDKGGDGGQDGGGDGGKGEQGDQKGDAGDKQDQEGGDGGSDGGSDRDGGMSEQEEAGRDGGSTSEAQMNKQDAEKLLDSMKNNEKNLQLWRFQQKKQRKVNDKDW